MEKVTKSVPRCSICVLRTVCPRPASVLKDVLIVLVAAAGGVVIIKVKLLAKRAVLLSLFLICIYVRAAKPGILLVHW